MLEKEAVALLTDMGQAESRVAALRKLAETMKK